MKVPNILYLCSFILVEATIISNDTLAQVQVVEPPKDRPDWVDTKPRLFSSMRFALDLAHDHLSNQGIALTENDISVLESVPARLEEHAKSVESNYKNFCSYFLEGYDPVISSAYGASRSFASLSRVEENGFQQVFYSVASELSPQAEAALIDLAINIHSQSDPASGYYTDHEKLAEIDSTRLLKYVTDVCNNVLKN